METLKDIWAALVAGVRDRTSNPLTLSFIVSWSLWNYKFFVILFEDTGSDERLKAIAALYPHESATYLGGALLYPLASALIYVFIYPVVSMVPIGVYRTYQVWTANLVKRVEKSRVLTQAEATTLTRRHEKEMTAMQEEMVSRAGELNELRNALKAAEEQITKLKADLSAKPDTAPDSPTSLSLPSSKPDPHLELPSSPPSEAEGTTLSPTETKLLIMLSNSATGLRAQDLSMSSNLNFSLVEEDLTDLARKALALPRPIGGADYWSLTPTGKSLAVNLLRNSPNR